jgi:hypothetical protein
MPGTNIPGVITAGTFYQHGKRVFWDVHNPENTVVIELRDNRYNELIIEVADPQAAVEFVKSVVAAPNWLTIAKLTPASARIAVLVQSLLGCAPQKMVRNTSLYGGHKWQNQQESRRAVHS